MDFDETNETLRDFDNKSDENEVYFRKIGIKSLERSLTTTSCVVITIIS